MKYVPHAWTLTAAGLLMTMGGMTSGSGALKLIGGLTVIAGLIWLNYAWDKLVQFTKRTKRHEREVENMKKAQANSDMIARAADRKANEAKTEVGKGQHIKGYIRDNSRIITFERKEA